MKTNKSITKRIRETKRGKLLQRPVGQNHFNSRATGEETLRKRGTKDVPAGAARAIRKRTPRA
jgi:ribosomal protein L35